jgi:osmotically-inducible protein OsmY
MRDVTAILLAAAVGAFTSSPVLAGSDATATNSGAKVVKVSSETAKASTDAAQKIHKSIASDPSFSLLAHKIQIDNHDGKVVLHGEVANQTERLAVGARARKIAGPRNVDNQLQLASTR